MLLCGVSTPQSVTLTGTNFIVPSVVLVTAPGALAQVSVTPDLSSSTSVTFTFVFATCGIYSLVVADATGACAECASAPFSLTPTPLPCPDIGQALTLGQLRQAVLHRLGDDQAIIWSVDEVNDYLTAAYRLLATELAIFWDQLYLENLPRGFSYTQPWEALLLDGSKDFDFGVGNYTAAFEQTAGASLGFDPRLRYGPANYTSPFEATDGNLMRAKASTAIPATADLPKILTKLDHVSWDNRSIEALEARSYSKMDARYEITAGEVYGYTWQKDGVRTLRKVRVPAAQCDTVTVTGSWGLLRTPADLSTDAITGSRGIARIIPGHHAIGPEIFGAPRRPFLEGKNVRVEYFREGRRLDDDGDVCELPFRYALYTRDYAQAQCLSRPGPGFDKELADHFTQRWARGLARIQRRLVVVDLEHTTVMGGDGLPSVTRPPRPALPWSYGSRVR
jgi:hypothetical protein